MSYLAIILSAGKSMRMGGNLKKAFCEIGKEALIIHLINSILLSKPSKILIVINSDFTEEEKQRIINFINGKYQCDFVYQNNPLGTGDAVKIAIKNCHENIENVIIFYSDTPLIEIQSILRIRDKLTNSRIGVICGFICNKQNQYGRIILNENYQIQQIIEYKDYKDNSEIQKIEQCNSGIIGAKFLFLKNYLSKLKNNNKANEYYLFDLINLTNDKFDYYELQSDEALGINTFQELEEVENVWQNSQRNYWAANFVQFLDRQSVYFGFNNKIGNNVKISRGVTFGKNVVIGDNCEIQDYVVIGDDVKIGSRTIIKPFSHIQSTVIGDDCEIGPNANLNGNNILGNKNIIGNFVEIKRSQMGDGNKAKHLAYIGDGRIGNKNNFGAGSIFCNYDGKNKYTTNIGDFNMIGANVSLIAPLTIGNNNVIAAGTVVSKDIGNDILVIERGEQKIKNLKEMKNSEL